jgi:hypothetical protein
MQVSSWGARQVKGQGQVKDANVSMSFYIGRRALRRVTEVTGRVGRRRGRNLTSVPCSLLRVIPSPTLLSIACGASAPVDLGSRDYPRAEPLRAPWAERN